MKRGGNDISGTVESTYNERYRLTREKQRDDPGGAGTTPENVR